VLQTQAIKQKSKLAPQDFDMKSKTQQLQQKAGLEPEMKTARAQLFVAQI
jgi:hypothetical protein